MKQIDRLDQIYYRTLREQSLKEEQWGNSGASVAVDLAKKALGFAGRKTAGVRNVVKGKIKRGLMNTVSNTWNRAKSKISGLKVESISGDEADQIAKFWGGSVGPEGVIPAIKVAKAAIFEMLANQVACRLLLDFFNEVGNDQSRPAQVRQALLNSLEEYEATASQMYQWKGLLASAEGRTILGVNHIYQPLTAILNRLIRDGDFGLSFSGLVSEAIMSAITEVVPPELVSAGITQTNADRMRLIDIKEKALMYKSKEVYFFIKVLLDRRIMDRDGGMADLTKFNKFMLNSSMGMMQKEYIRAKKQWTSRHSREAGEEKADRHRNGRG